HVPSGLSPAYRLAGESLRRRSQVWPHDQSSKKQLLRRAQLAKPPLFPVLPSGRGFGFPKRQSVCGRHQPRELLRCIHLVSSTTSNCDRRVPRAGAVRRLRSRGGCEHALPRLADFPGPEFQRRADRILTRSERAFRGWLVVLIVVFLCLYPGFVERLIAVIPLSLFMLSLKDQVRICYESGQSSV